LDRLESVRIVRGHLPGFDGSMLIAERALRHFLERSFCEGYGMPAQSPREDRLGYLELGRRIVWAHVEGSVSLLNPVEVKFAYGTPMLGCPDEWQRYQASCSRQKENRRQ
jgi:hypothetical protein